MDSNELCHKVAVKVVGYNINKHGEYEKDKTFVSFLCPISFTPADAMRVVGKMTEKGWGFNVSNHNRETYGYEVSFWPVGNPLKEVRAFANNFPEAVFRAALKAVGGAK